MSWSNPCCINSSRLSGYRLGSKLKSFAIADSPRGDWGMCHQDRVLDTGGNLLFQRSSAAIISGCCLRTPHTIPSILWLRKHINANYTIGCCGGGGGTKAYLFSKVRQARIPTWKLPREFSSEWRYSKKESGTSSTRSFGFAEKLTWVKLPPI